MQSINPRNIYLAPNIRIKALKNVGFRFTEYAWANSDLHVLNICRNKYLFKIYLKVLI